MGWHQTVIIGNVGRDPELRYTSNGTPVCSFSVAVTEKWNDRQSSERREKTTWYRVSCWRGLAETANRFVHKGMQIMVAGTVEATAYTNNAGEVVGTLELTARDMQFLGGQREEGGGNYGGGYSGGDDGYDSDRGGRQTPPPADLNDIPF
jgi:single-strand DNA-binding protein